MSRFKSQKPSQFRFCSAPMLVQDASSSESITAPCSWVQVQMQEREKRLEKEGAEVDLMCKRLECHV